MTSRAICSRRRASRAAVSPAGPVWAAPARSSRRRFPRQTSRTRERPGPAQPSACGGEHPPPGTGRPRAPVLPTATSGCMFCRPNWLRALAANGSQARRNRRPRRPRGQPGFPFPGWPRPAAPGERSRWSAGVPPAGRLLGKLLGHLAHGFRGLDLGARRDSSFTAARTATPPGRRFPRLSSCGRRVRGRSACS